MALGWTIFNIKGISSSICTHKILMEDNVQLQMLNKALLGGNPRFFFFFFYFYFLFLFSSTLLFFFHFVGIKRPKKSSMGTRLHLKEKYSIKNQGSISSPFSFFIQFFFLFPIEDNVKFKYRGREFILFVPKKKKLPMIRIWLKFLIIFRNHSHCLSLVVNCLFDLV